MKTRRFRSCTVGENEALLLRHGSTVVKTPCMRCCGCRVFCVVGLRGLFAWLALLALVAVLGLLGLLWLLGLLGLLCWVCSACSALLALLCSALLCSALIARSRADWLACLLARLLAAKLRSCEAAK